ncbi:MAG: hypothetical protein HYV09_02720 [Deltaproteobacteria bacterium]|nr:hypothetical protein [Deltaproteobacteria bacterium]
MTDPERAAIAALSRLRGEIAEDRASMTRCAADADQARARLLLTPDDHAVLALAAVSLHGWYTALEAVLERVARQLDGGVPAGHRWHREILTQLSVEVPTVRPAVLPSALTQHLADLLAFRHFFRHAYGVLLDGVRLEGKLRVLASVGPQVDEALDRFDTFLAAAAQP